MVSPGPGGGEELVQALAVDGGAGLLVDVDPRVGDADAGQESSWRSRDCLVVETRAYPKSSPPLVWSLRGCEVPCLSS